MSHRKTRTAYAILCVCLSCFLVTPIGLVENVLESRKKERAIAPPKVALNRKGDSTPKGRAEQ